MNILLVTPNPPWPTHTGSAQRTALLHDALSAHGEVRLLCLLSREALTENEWTELAERHDLVGTGRRTGPVGRAPWKTLAVLDRRSVTRLAHFVDASRSRYEPDERLIASLELDRALADVSLVVGRYTTSLPCLGLLDRGIPTLIDVDDVDSAALHSQAKATDLSRPERWNAARHYRHVVRGEQRVFSRASGLWVANPDDLDVPGLGEATFLPNIPFGGSGGIATAPSFDPPTVGCIASYGHAPNVESVDWFLSSVWKDVRAAVPSARFLVYGSQLADTIAARWSAHDGVDVIGFVERVEDAYAAMSLSVCPVQRGAGTNIKVLESARHGRLCVLSASAARGFERDPALAGALVTTRTAREMADGVIHHLVDRAANQRATTAFTAAVEAGYSRGRFDEAVDRGVEHALRRSRVPA